MFANINKKKNRGDKYKCNVDYSDSTYVDPTFLFSGGYNSDKDLLVCPDFSGPSLRSQLCS